MHLKPHSFNSSVIHSRASHTGCTDMPPFDPFRCPPLEAILIHSFITLVGIYFSVDILDIATMNLGSSCNQ